ncbi:MAG: c-type cytochrome [Vicinamibacterales bacterium]|jgi:cytochrome c oxidase cbb3-type subunit 3|nr:c-type cytochrome [Vicinamibacterales bacterium]
MAQFEDKVLHELDGIKEYDNPMPGWLMAIWWGSLIFAAAYLIFYALSFGEGSMEAEYRADTQRALTAIQAHFDANPLVAPSPAELLAGARDPAVLDIGAARFTRSCASCHGAEAQGLIGPNLTDAHWIHGGSVEQVFQSVAKGWPAKGMPPWGRAMRPEELAAVVSYVRSIQGTTPPNAKPPEGEVFAPEPIPGS